MIVLGSVIIFYSSNNSNPITIAISILVLSLITAFLLFNASLSSWIGFVTILTFSSGIITLFMYTASLSSNENNKYKKSILIIGLPILLLTETNVVSSNTNETINIFSINTIIILIMLVIVITILVISSHGHHPNQTLNSSF